MTWTVGVAAVQQRATAAVDPANWALSTVPHNNLTLLVPTAACYIYVMQPRKMGPAILLATGPSAIE